MVAAALPKGVHRVSALERVYFGRAAAEALAEEAELTLAKRLQIMTTASLAESPLVRDLTEGLGARCAGVFQGIVAHSPRECVIAGARAALAAGADMLVAVGGGSVVDATKAMQFCLWNGVADIDDMDRLRSKGRVDPSKRDDAVAAKIRMTAVPTTLSAAEFTWYAGVTNRATGMKEAYEQAYLVPRAVIIDPAATTTTPGRLFLSTGIKAIDHAVERICSTNANALSDASALHALTLLAGALPRVAASPQDLAARLDCQLAAWLSIAGGASGVGVGASHAIGHVLGAFCDVPHGLTSCVVLPSVMRWNAPSTGERHAMIARAMGKSDSSAADIVEKLIQSLGLPTRLSEVGVRPDRFAAISEKALGDRNMGGNPRPVRGISDVVEILSLAA